MSAAPTLTRLCDKLRTHRMEKAMEPTWRKAVRRSINSLRVEAAEWIKRHPAMLRLIR